MDIQGHEPTNPASMIAKLRKSLTLAGILLIIRGLVAVIMPSIGSLVVEILVG